MPDDAATGGRAAAARVASDVRAVLEPIAAAAGIDIEDVVVRPAGSRTLLQVTVDRDGGVSLDDVAEISRQCSAALDAADVVAGSYVLEISSPGVDRPLTAPRHWRRNVGRLVEVHRRDGGPIAGRVSAADDETVTLETPAGSHVLPLASISRGAVQVEFARVADAVEPSA